MNFSCRVSLMLAALLLAAPALAAEIEGIKLADRIKLPDGGPELVLNGAGVRTRVFFKVYVGALYLQAKKTGADSALSDTGPKRVSLHLLREVTSEQLMSSFNDGLRDNHTAEQLAPVEPRLKEFSAIFASVKAVKPGDVILIDYVPPAGTRVTVNGELKGTVPGEEFNRALLRIWLGEKPADAHLKKAMLGG